jgi:hypothetical protein
MQQLQDEVLSESVYPRDGTQQKEVGKLLHVHSWQERYNVRRVKANQQA